MNWLLLKVSFSLRILQSFTMEKSYHSPTANIQFLNHNFPLYNQNICSYNDIYHQAKGVNSMTSVTSHTSYDFKPHTIVPVIASFNSEGHVKPLYVRIGGLSLKVHSSWLKPSFGNILEFHCMVIDDNCLKPLILSYHQMESVWIIPRLADP